MDNVKLSQPRRGSLSPSVMRRTLWSTKSPIKETQLSDDNKANVQVVLRCRPMTEVELEAGTPVMISCDEKKQEVTVVQNSAHKQPNRNFVFDKVFAPETQQKELFDNVVAPIVNEVLEGYNWTVFAYGQTGTGKTYTMEGEGGKDEHGQFNKNAGVIPRAVQQIFDILDGERADYSVKVSYLELYNEEITDLLSPDEESKRQLMLMEDGKGSVFVRDLEEEIVCSADEIYAVLERGSARKHVATLLKNRSNRAHSILSITVQVKEMSSVGSDMIKRGKLNLVDLAGSENILRWGSIDMLNVIARETGEINKSLLTLSRVINALADNSAHVPYRDSKLTRLLRDSLGGTTKTCIIATISQSLLSQEETLCTLDIASRARSIKNKPEVNQKVSKSTLLKDLSAQVDSLKRELRMKRESNGVCVPHQNQHSEGRARKQLMELQELYLNQQHLMEDLKEKLERTQKELTETQQSFIHLEDQYKQAREVIKDKEAMMLSILGSGKALTERALELRCDLEGTASDVSSLLSRIEHKNHLEDQNKHNIQDFYTQLTQQLDELGKVISAVASNQEQKLKVVQDESRSFLTSKSGASYELLKQIETLKDLYASGIKHLNGSAEELFQNSQLGLYGLNYELLIHSSCITDLVMKSSLDANTKSNGLKLDLHHIGSSLDTFVKQQQENKVKTYDAAKFISQSLLDFFKTLKIYISKLSLMEEDSRTITNQKMIAFKKKFEEYALDEEKLLVEQISRMLASSRSRKENLIQAAVGDIIDSAREQQENIKQEVSEMHMFAIDAEENWTGYIQKTETNYMEDSAALEAGKRSIRDGLQSCISKSTEASEQRRAAEESLLQVLNKNSESVDSFIKNILEDNGKINIQFSSATSSLLEETDNSGKNAALSIEYLVNLDHEESEKINSLISCSLEGMRNINHSQKVGEIYKNARQSLVDNYLVDDSSDTSLRKRSFDLPSKESLQNLMNIRIGHSLGTSIHPDVVTN